MNKELKQKWVEALRSGKYEQGRGSLHPSADTFCCLGVLCDLVAPEKWATELNVLGFDFLENKEGAMLPRSVGDKCDVSEISARRLAMLNDNLLSSFSTVADHIEANL